MNNNNSAAGFRLQYLEIFNWGTFDKKIYRISPDGQTSLLTGANGSGKTTIVDAILTLLVPKNKRFYNQASGTDVKKGRTEDSYVLGHYGKTQDDEQLTASIQSLREKSGAKASYSVLLACFSDTVQQQHVTLAQIRWFANNDLQRMFIVAPYEVDIQNHFSPFTPNAKADWKKRLKNQFPKIEFYDNNFEKYSQSFSDIFGLKDKALSLFNRAIGTKVVNNLDEFIKTNMLEETNIEDEFRKLLDNYEGLQKAHNTMEKAKLQLQLLDPMLEEGEVYEHYQQEVTDLASARHLVPAWFATEKVNLLEKAIEQKQEDSKKTRRKLDDVEAELENLKSQEAGLRVSIERDETGAKINVLKKEIAQLEKSKTGRENERRKYNRIAEDVGFPTEPDESVFDHSRQRAKSWKQEIEQQADVLNEKWFDERRLLKDREKEREENLQLLEGLKSQKGNITGRVAEIRQELLEALQLPESDIPFIGELIRVRSSESAWENAIERVLHSFALNILVPDKYIAQVDQYLNSRNLRGRVVYHKVDTKKTNPVFPKESANSLVSKLDLRRDSIYIQWLEKNLFERFDYSCVDSPEEFQYYTKALTKEGLIKNADRREKDDRPEKLSKNNYVLGWDNKEKIRLLQAQLKASDEQIKQQEKAVREIDKQKKQAENVRETLTRLLGFDDFEKINWQADALQISEKLAQMKQLQETSNQLKELQQQLEELLKKLKSTYTEQQELSGMLIHAKRDIEDFEKQKAGSHSTLSEYRGINLAQAFEKLQPYLEQTERDLNMANIDRVQHAAERWLTERWEEKNRGMQKSRKEIEQQMQAFKYPGDEIAGRFLSWRGETQNLPTDADFMGEYRKLHDRLRKEDLPTYQERFKTYLQENTFTAITDFRQLLYNQKDDIEESIDHINESLRRIDFNVNPTTYIQLSARPAADVKIKGFKEELKQWKPNFAEYELTRNEALLEKSFSDIQQIIKKLTEDEAYRRKVTDVRNWLDFTAKEFYKENDKQFKVHENSLTDSGGEGAQFTYTILGAAIAYQFGINQEARQQRSFRFITVDEAFSKLDPEKSRYLMELCNQLHLQVMIVTPLDKIHIVEPYAGSYFYVENKNKRNSEVYTLTREQYNAKREELTEMAAQEQ